MLFAYKKHIRDRAADAETGDERQCRQDGMVTKPMTDIADELEDNPAEIIGPFELAGEHKNTEQKQRNTARAGQPADSAGGKDESEADKKRNRSPDAGRDFEPVVMQAFFHRL